MPSLLSPFAAILSLIGILTLLIISYFLYRYLFVGSKIRGRKSKGKKKGKKNNEVDNTKSHQSKEKSSTEIRHKITSESAVHLNRNPPQEPAADRLKSQPRKSNKLTEDLLSYDENDWVTVKKNKIKPQVPVEGDSLLKSNVKKDKILVQNKSEKKVNSSGDKQNSKVVASKGVKNNKSQASPPKTKIISQKTESIEDEWHEVSVPKQKKQRTRKE